MVEIRLYLVTEEGGCTMFVSIVETAGKGEFSLALRTVVFRTAATVRLCPRVRFSLNQPIAFIASYC